jgi:hypothetical protein
VKLGVTVGLTVWEAMGDAVKLSVGVAVLAGGGG